MAIPQSSHYQTLDLTPQATADDIKTRFRQLALTHHPDHAGASAEAQARFLVILNAWRVLGDPVEREAYDHYLNTRPAAAPPVKNPSSRRKTSKATAQQFHDSLNSLLWDIEDRVTAARTLEEQKTLMRILTFWDQWILTPAGYVDYFMEARGLERLNPAAYIDFICQSPVRLTHFPFTSVANYYYDVRKRMNRYLDKLGNLPWLDPIPGKSVRFIDALLEAQNLAVHFLGGRGTFVPSHPDFL